MAKKTYRDIKNSIPGLESEAVEALADRLDDIQAIKRLWNSDGGKQLLTILKDNCLRSLVKLRIASQNDPTVGELVTHISTYFANADLLATLQDVSLEKEISNQLDEAVKQAASSLQT